MGIEPTWSAWKAEVLPLNYIRVSFNTFIIIKGNDKKIKYFLLIYRKNRYFSIYLGLGDIKCLKI